IVTDAFARLKPGGRIVADMASIDNVSEGQAFLRESTGDVKIWMFNVAKGNYQLERVRFEAQNPIFVLSAIKPDNA
ncbi:MAG: cobalamin biosynthesis bifunctional protein CbiET, partial [Planctomycetaceae bacterium]|nr:cobalamin biosynthesis bifunctional protein CbiET [Planctomycetaceae bacterium]